jgi:hypothetical protein
MSTSGQRKLNKFLSNTKCNVLVMYLKIRVNDNPSFFMPALENHLSIRIPPGNPTIMAKPINAGLPD